MTGRDPDMSKARPDVFWIERGRWPLLRIETQIQHTHFRVGGVTACEPALDAAIADNQFVFDPPAR